MSTVDERIVEMRFDNKQFEQNASTTMSTLDKLKQALRLDGAGKGFKDAENAANSFSMSSLSSIADSIAAIENKFSAFGILGMRVMTRLADQAIDTGKRLVKSLSIDQVSEGWSKYEQKTSSVQTIISATGKSIEEVSEQLDKLNWFTDETSYNFIDMVNNIGKFTNNAVELSTAVTAMEGISTWAASAGANVGEAGRAMYNLSQAISVGSVKLMDWKSIENANMATTEFKQSAIDTAVALGTLTKRVDGTYRTLKGHVVSASNFNEALSDQWFSKDVLLNTLNNYGNFTDALAEATDLTGTTATEFLGYMDEYRKGGEEQERALHTLATKSGVTVDELQKVFERMTTDISFEEGLNKATKATGLASKTFLEYLGEYKNGTIDWEKVTKKTGKSVEDLTESFELMRSTEFGLGEKAFRMAQEAKTFSEAISATKDAVSTGWMTTWELIFGNYEEAKALWSDLAEEMYNVFAESGNIRNEILSRWKNVGGRDKLIEGFKELYGFLKSIASLAKTAFDNIFPPMTVVKLLAITRAFKNFADNLKLTVMTSGALYGTFSGIFSVFKLVFKTISAVYGILKPGIELVKELVVSIMHLIGSIGSSITIFSNNNKKLTDFYSIIERIANIIGSLLGPIIRGVIDTINDLANSTFNVSSIFDIFGRTINGILDFFENTVEAIKAFGTRLKNAFKELKKSLSDSTDNPFGGAMDNFSKLGNVFNTGLVAVVLLGIRKLVANFKKLSDIKSKSIIEDLTSGIAQIKDSISDLFSSFQKGSDFAGKVMKVAIALGILSVSLVLLASVQPDRLGLAIAGMGAVITELVTALVVLADLTKGANLKNVTKAGIAMIEIAAAVLVLSKAIKTLGDLSPEQVVVGLMAITVLLTEVTASASILSAQGSRMMKGATGMIAIAAAVYILGKSVKELGVIDPETLTKGLLAVGALLLELSAFATITSGTKGLISAGLGMIAVSAAILILQKAVAGFAKMQPEKLSQGLITVSIALAEFAAFGKLLSGSKKLVGVGIAMIAVSTSMVILSNALEKMGNMNPDALGRSLGAVGAALIEFGLALNLMKGTLGAATAMLVASAALGVFAGVISFLSSLEPEKVVIALLEMGAAIGILGLAGALLGPVVPALLGLAGALVLISIAIVAASAGITALGVGLTALAATMKTSIKIIVSGIGELLTGIAMYIPMLATMIGTGVLTVLNVVASFIPTLANIILQFIVAVISVIGNNVGPIIAAAAMLIVNFLNAVSLYLPIIVDAGLNFITSFINGLAMGIINNTDKMILAVENLLISILFTVVSFVEEAVSGIPVIGDKISGALDGVKDKLKEEVEANAAEIAQAGADSMSGFEAEYGEEGASALQHYSGSFDGASTEIASKVSEMANAGIIALGPFKDEFATNGEESATQYADAISGAADNAKTSGETIGDSGVEGAASKVDDFTTTGENSTLGFANGLVSTYAITSVRTNAETIARTAINAVNDTMGVRSPSRVLMQTGRYADEGLAIGLIQGLSSIKDAGARAGNEAINSISNSIKAIGKLLTDDIDDQMVLTPVLDLSNIESGVSTMNSMLDGQRPSLAFAGFNESLANANLASRSFTDSMMANAANSADETSKWNKLADRIVKGVSDSVGNMEVHVDSNVTLEGEARGLFKAVRKENGQYRKITGASAFK